MIDTKLLHRIAWGTYASQVAGVSRQLLSEAFKRTEAKWNATKDWPERWAWTRHSYNEADNLLEAQ